MTFAALSVILRGLSGRDMVLPVGQDLVSAQPLNSVYRWPKRRGRTPRNGLGGPGGHLEELAAQTPNSARRVAELQAIGHRGPAEVEMRRPATPTTRVCSAWSPNR